jgi:precorrin-2 dehydrogenase / sirohydrochlorin ferrochelatase
MSSNIAENISHEGTEYAVISLLSKKIRVLVIGGGNAGLIKTKGFAAKGCEVTVLSKDFLEQFYSLENTHNVRLISEEYSPNHLENYHVIVIAFNHKKLVENIKNYCESKGKLYLTCSDFKEGNFIVPVQGSSKSIYYSINTKEGSPRTSLYLGQKVKNCLIEYDELVEYAAVMRKKLKGTESLKDVMSFISSDDFNFIVKKGYGDRIISMFYPEIEL